MGVRWKIFHEEGIERHFQREKMWMSQGKIVSTANLRQEELKFKSHVWSNT
jgi:hypothetical protein